MKHLNKFLLVILSTIVFNCVQDTKLKTITLKVDTRYLTNPTTIGVRGNTAPLNWERSMTMSDTDNDGIYETTFNLNSASYNMQFKFVLNDSVFELEGYNNRSIVFEYKPETIIYQGVFNNPEEISVTKN